MSTADCILTPSFYARYRPVPQRPFFDLIAGAARLEMKLAGFRVDVENAERLPRRPALLCTNSTQTYDFLALMKGLDQHGHRVVTITKAKNYHHGAMAFVMKRVGALPLASRGYFLLADFIAVHGRRPRDDEYRALRSHLDSGAALPDREPFVALQNRARMIGGHSFVPSTTTWRAQLELVFQRALDETTRLARSAIEAGYHVQIYPEGTVSARLGVGRTGAAKLARALGVPLVPIGMSGCPDAFLGRTPIPWRGRVTLRVGSPVDECGSLDDVTARIMDALDHLVDERYRRSNELAASSKGTRALL